MPYMLLSVSVIVEVFATTMLKVSEGFTILVPSLLVVVGYVISFGIFVIVLKHMSLGLAYGIWGGAGTALTTLIGVVMYDEPFTLFTGLGLALIVAGIIALNSGSQDDIDHQLDVANGNVEP